LRRWGRPGRISGALLALAISTCALRAACGGSEASPPGGGSADAGQAAPSSVPDAAAAAGQAPFRPGAIPHVFVVAMENQDAARIYGNAKDAPYINGTLLPRYARATAFSDELPQLPSEPHYLWMEAGTNAFPDHTFTTDGVPSASNSTTSTDHLASQIAAAGGGLDWRAYQEGIGDATGRCPILAAGLYVPRHNPFVFFHDVAGAPPAKDDARCAAHHRELAALAADLASGDVAGYSFITPNLCHDMHGAHGCPNANRTRAGDDWLAASLPALIDFVSARGGVIFITWEEGDKSSTLPFLAVGPGVKPGYAGGVAYTHSSLLKTVEEMLGLPVLPAVAGANDLGDLFSR
jgi:hypothetical protein